MAAAQNSWTPRGRPLSTLAINFSAALDDLFKLGTVGELQETVEEKNRQVATQQSTLETLEEQLRRADEELKRLEKKHKRMSRRFSPRQPIEGFFDHELGQLSSDTDESSPRSEQGEAEVERRHTQQ